MTNSIRTLRRENGLTLTDLATQIPATKAELSRWETGARKVPATRAARIAEITGIPRHVLRPDVFPAQEQSA